MNTFMVIVLMYIAVLALPYHNFYVQTDEGLEPARARRRHDARMKHWSLYARTIPGLPIPKQERLHIERQERIQLNMERIAEWPLATDEELAVYDVPQLQARLDSRNLKSDQIFALLCELDDPVNRSQQRQVEIGRQIQQLRMDPLKELERESDGRVGEILSRHQ